MVASAKVIRRTAIGLFIADSILTVAGVLVLLKFPWAAQIGTFAMALFVAGGYWGNHAVFGDFRPVHTTSNVVIAIVVSWLLWAGYPALGDGAAI